MAKLIACLEYFSFIILLVTGQKIRKKIISIIKIAKYFSIIVRLELVEIRYDTERFHPFVPKVGLYLIE